MKKLFIILSVAAIGCAPQPESNTHRQHKPQPECECKGKVVYIKPDSIKCTIIGCKNVQGNMRYMVRDGNMNVWKVEKYEIY